MVNIASYFRKQDGKEEPPARVTGPLLSLTMVYYGCPSEINPEACESVVNGDCTNLLLAFTWSKTRYDDDLYWHHKSIGREPLSEEDILYVRHVWALALE